jgi:hypothetical protein
MARRDHERKLKAHSIGSEKERKIATRPQMIHSEKSVCVTLRYLLIFFVWLLFRRFEYLNSDEATLAHKKYVFNINF